MAERSASLAIDTETPIELPVYPASVGPAVIDVGALTARGYFTYDPGFVSTASCDSAITYIDGDEGVLLHRGYPIEQLAAQSTHLELCYLLLHDRLPRPGELQTFVDSIKRHAAVDEQTLNFYTGFRRDAHPMSIMCAVTAAMAALYHDAFDADDEGYRLDTAHRLIAKMPNLAAMTYRHARGEPFVPPRDDLDYAENFLHMMFAPSGGDYEVNPVLARAFDRIFLLHADHEQNA
ncbi:MAG: citrate (Si)-synthase, partial [Gammaproteobacteria bacterium]|nr:citrate (Si)-synthase [Gammaproteobacteria bacterium]